ncbi:MAG: diaminopimelate epimerase [Desulfobacteraceae bacterium 4572_35.1]|nr:MAG: diaminopimelate epimerase [Desulfobacteraceae bacterium 4572_35.1]
MKFVKMHGAGNDYVYVDCFNQCVDDPARLAREVSSRNFGVGSDGLILILPSGCADARMRIFNADGSEAEMCGNGVRCVAKYVYDHGIAHRDHLHIETNSGVLALQLFTDAHDLVERVRVDMGEPRLQRGKIPMLGDADSNALGVELEVGGRNFKVSCLSVGNPHCVVFVDDVDNFDVHQWGEQLENHPQFPQRINVEFVQIVSRNEVCQRTWERGAGETLACGTGSSAVTVASFLAGYTERRIVNHLRGGDLEMEYSEAGVIYMTGPATEVFSGQWPEKQV